MQMRLSMPRIQVSLAAVVSTGQYTGRRAPGCSGKPGRSAAVKRGTPKFQAATNCRWTISSILSARHGMEEAVMKRHFLPAVMKDHWRSEEHTSVLES